MALYYAKESSLHGRTYRKGRGYPKAIAPPGQLSSLFSLGQLELAQLNLLFEFVSFAQN